MWPLHDLVNNISAYHIPVFGRQDRSVPHSSVDVVRVNPNKSYNQFTFGVKWAEMARGNSYVISVVTRKYAGQKP